MSARLNASTEPMSGTGAPALTMTPTPTRARLARLPSTSLPLPVRSLTAAGVSTATSKASPPSIRFLSAPTVSFSTVTLWPVCFSNSGSTASSTCLNAPAVKTLISAAATPRGALSAMTTTASVSNAVLMSASSLSGIIQQACSCERVARDPHLSERFAVQCREHRSRLSIILPVGTLQSSASSRPWLALSANACYSATRFLRTTARTKHA